MDIPSSEIGFAIKPEISETNTSSQEQGALTTATCIHLSIWAELDAMNRPVMTFQNLPLLSIDPMNTNPLIPQVSCDEAVLEDRVYRGRRWGIRERKAVRSLAIGESRYERDGVARSHDQALCRNRHFHRSDGVGEGQASRQLPCSKIPPSYRARSITLRLMNEKSPRT